MAALGYTGSALGSGLINSRLSEHFIGALIRTYNYYFGGFLIITIVEWDPKPYSNY